MDQRPDIYKAVNNFKKHQGTLQFKWSNRVCNAEVWQRSRKMSEKDAI